MVSPEKPCRLDAALDEYGRQEALHQHSVIPLVKRFIQDCENASVMTYGQTGSAKTHAMMGYYDQRETRGMIARAIESNFNLSNSTSTDTIGVSYFEIYNQRLYDLLCGQSMKTALMHREKTIGSKSLN